MAKLAGLIILLLGISTFSAVSTLDCSGLVKELSHGVLNWLGEVTFIVPVSTTSAGWTNTLTFDQNFTGVGTWELFVESNRTQRIAVFRDREGYDNTELTAGEIFTFRFRINYGVDIPKPQVTSMNFQGVELCK